METKELMDAILPNIKNMLVLAFEEGYEQGLSHGKHDVIIDYESLAKVFADRIALKFKQSLIQ
jgi:hypothetical protein